MGWIREKRLRSRNQREKAGDGVESWGLGVGGGSQELREESFQKSEWLLEGQGQGGSGEVKADWMH